MNTFEARTEAQKAYRGGEGLEANPCQKGTAEYDAFMLEMGRLLGAELRGIREELKGGV